MSNSTLNVALPSLIRHCAALPKGAASIAGLALCAALLAACGGGGGGDGSAPAPIAFAIPPSTQFKGALVNLATGAGALAGDWSAATCTDNRQKNWVRSFLNENYLFYREAPLISIDPNTYTGTVENLFGDYTVRGVPAKDRFSFVLTQADADGTFQTGSTTDVGFKLRRDSSVVDGSGRGIIRIAYVEPNGPAAAAGFARGMVLASVDGVATAFSLPIAQFNKLFNSVSGTSSTVGVQDTINGPIRFLTVATAAFSTTPLLLDRVLPGTTTGYLAFNSFASPIGEKQLADAFQRFAAAGATELVVDLRYNGGGYIDIASELGYMVAGQIQTSGKIFESLVYNDKRTSSNNSIPFASTITGFFGNPTTPGVSFAALNLRRVYVLSTGSTCSASESFISGLRGIDVEVIQIGGTTCGKPYGFSQTNNCTLSYFALEFEGRNNKGVVTSVTGITPTCAANDDFNHALGDPAERLLATALSYQASGACVVIAAAQPSPLALSLGSAQRLGLAPQNGSVPNVDMEFMAKPAESAKLYRGAK